ncbi:MAG: CopG family antitoxin [Gallionella sp.]|jgi:hypothetical protein
MSKEPASEATMSEELSAIPQFADEAEALAFWEKHDAINYMDWADVKNVVLPTKKTVTETIALALPVDIMDCIKREARLRNMPYRGLIEAWLQEKVDGLK